MFFDRAYPISCHAVLDMAACAAFVKESRMKIANATKLNRNPGRSGEICGGEHVALSQVSDLPAAEMLRFVNSHGMEGAVAKRSDSP
jgi:hypothetical protein